MSSAWDDFKDTSREARDINIRKRSQESPEDDSNRADSCSWGLNDDQEPRADSSEQVDAVSSSSSKFITTYEKYLDDKRWLINLKTTNYNQYKNSPSKAIREWFEIEGFDFAIKTEHRNGDEFVCSLELPVEDQDFLITSNASNSKHKATDEICMIACKLLDECQLLYRGQHGSGGDKEDPERKRRIEEANKEDDIELDSTTQDRKRLCDDDMGSRSANRDKVHTYESLNSRWQELNMKIVQLKAKLIRMDLSLKKGNGSQQASEAMADEEDNEVDPLDAYMSELETKTKFTRDEKIERTRMKAQMAAYEREQEEVSRLIALAAPNCDLSKKFPSASRSN